MGTGTTVRAWSTTAATNSTADTDITSSDSISPDTLDNIDRTIMAAVKRQEEDTGGALAAGGTANALTVTTNQLLTSGQLTAGVRVLIRATADNTSATVTFAPDGLTAANIKCADGSALRIGSIKSGMYLDLVYNSGSSEWRCANIAPASSGSSAGLVLLTSGTVAAATLDLVLTTYTGYRGIKIFLSGFLPATDGAGLVLRFSSDGGGSYYATAYNHAGRQQLDTLVGTDVGSGSTTDIGIAGACGNAANEGYNGEITILNQTSGAFWARAFFIGYCIDNSATPAGKFQSGGGSHEVAEDIDAVRFLFSSGNIAAGNYAVYGLV